MNFDWLTKYRKLSPAALTVRGQVLSPNDNGRLLWDIFFPLLGVRSIRLSEIVPVDDRPVSDRREWDAPGRAIPLVIPGFRDLEMIPIEATDRVNEYEMQILSDNANQNEEIIQEQLQVSIPARTDRLVQANWRRNEVDCFSAWRLGKVTVRNPQDGKSQEVSLNMAGDRYEAAVTPWDDAGVNAYDLFIASMEEAKDRLGPVEAAMCRLKVIKTIQKDAPDLANGVKMTRAQLEDRIVQDLGQPFRFIENEQSLDIFVDGGAVKVRTKVWNGAQVGFIPEGGIIGNSYAAPVVRAGEYAKKNPEARIDLRGNAVYLDPTKNDGKELQMQAQLNVLGVPHEEKVYVVDSGINLG